MRCHELAKELGVLSKDMVLFLQASGIILRSASSILDDHVVQMIREEVAEGRGPVKPQLGSPKVDAALESLRAKLGATSPEHQNTPASELQAPLIDQKPLNASKEVQTRESTVVPEAKQEHAVPVVESEGTADAVDSGEPAGDLAAHASEVLTPPAKSSAPDGASMGLPKPRFHEYQHGETGVSFETLLVPYLLGATEITITDPYVRTLHQARNVMELLESLLRAQVVGVRVRLRTSKDKEADVRKQEEQRSYLDRVASAVEGTGVSFTYSLEPGLHGRTIIANSGWRIILDRGLDIFYGVPSDPLHLAHRMQEHRKVKQFYVDYRATTESN